LDPTLSYILFAGSPFLPPTDRVSYHQMKVDILQLKGSPATAIAEEICYIGLRQNALHRQDQEYLTFFYGTDVMGLENYRLGFISPPSLIAGAGLFDHFPPQEVIKHLCPPAEGPIAQGYNAYKAQLLFQARDVFEAATSKEPLQVALPIYDLCRNKPFVDDRFFFIGLAASEELYIQYAHLLGYA